MGVTPRTEPIAIPGALRCMSLTPPRFKYAGVSMGYHADEIRSAPAGVDAHTSARIRDTRIRFETSAALAEDTMP
jgi:hypothetical protein